MAASSNVAFALFDTALGTCAIVWGARGVLRFLLPERSRAATESRVRELFGSIPEEAPRGEILDATTWVTHQLAGGRRDEARPQVRLDLEQHSPFARKVARILVAVPPGQTITYGELAARAGSKGGARAVGRAMATNPLPILVPCHRVLAANGKAGGFTAYGGLATKARLLALEGVQLELPATSCP